MNTLFRQFKKYASGALLLVVLLSPLHSSAALLSEDIDIMRYQVRLITEAIETSTSIPQARKGELRAVVDSINDIIAIYARQVAANPDAVSLRRVNIENVIVNGDAKDFTSQVQVVWGPEQVGDTSYERSTTTYDYSFITTLAERKKTDRVRELANQTLKQLSLELGFSTSKLRATSSISIKRFDDATDAQNNYIQPEVGAGLERLFGHFSIIDEVYVVAGKDQFVFELHTDQDETIELSVSQTTKGFDDMFVYRVTYAIYDVNRITAINESTERDTMVKQLTSVLPGIGEQFNVTDEVLIDELIEFMLDHTVLYRDYSKEVQIWADLTAQQQQNILDQQDEPADCHAPQIQKAVAEMFFFYLQNYQITTDPDLVQVIAPTETIINTYEGSQLRSHCWAVDNEFFPSLNL